MSESGNASGRRLGRFAAVAGLAGAGYLSARVKSVLDGLSTERSPYAWKPSTGSSFLLKGANLIDVKRGQVQRERGILVRDGAIVEVVSTRDLDRVNADLAFDCSGLFAMPGLINCHVHMLLPGASYLGLNFILSVKRQVVRNFEECPVHGVTTVRDAATAPLMMNTFREKIDAFEMLGPRVLMAGPGITAPGGYPDFAFSLPGKAAERVGDFVLYASDPQSARRAVRTAVEQGADFIKTFLDDRSLMFGRKPLNTMDDETVRALIDEAHRLGKRVAAHQSQISGFRRALRLGIDDLEHNPADAELTEEDIELLLRGDHNITPTGTVNVALGIAPEGHPALSNPVFAGAQAERNRLYREVYPAMSEPWVAKTNIRMEKIYLKGSPGSGPGGRFMTDNDLSIDGVIMDSRNIPKLYEAGASVCCGNDGGVTADFPAAISAEMGLLETYGIPRADILRAATVSAAGLIGMQDRLGTLESGRLADILLLSADPLKDIRAVERIEAVFRSGVLLHEGQRFAPRRNRASKE